MKISRNRKTAKTDFTGRKSNKSKTRFLILASIFLIAVTSTVAFSSISTAGSLGDLLSGSASLGETLTKSFIQDDSKKDGKSSRLMQLAPDSLVSELTSARSGHTATRLDDTKVLITGGDTGGTAEIFDAAAGSSAPTGSLSAARSGHTATKLANGRVLILGGTSNGAVVASTEIYDAATGTFNAGATMNAARSGQTATVLADGKILIAGGDLVGSAEIYDPAANTFTAVSTMTSSRAGHSAALLKDGRILIVGGSDAQGNELNSAEIFDPASSTFSATGNEMAHHRTNALLRVLPDGKVQIIGGNDDMSMEVYDPAIDTIGAHAHLIPTNDEHDALLQSDILAAQTRAAMFHNGQSDALFDRSNFTVTELGSQALVAGGANTSGTVLSSLTVVNSSDATVTTDELDYQPGQTAKISGTGWQAGETVNIIIHEDPHTHTERRLTTTADNNGNFTVNYLVEEHDLNVTFIIGAKGVTSGLTAQTTFTDSKPNTVTVGSQTPTSVTAGASATYLITVNFNGNSNSCTSTLSINSVLPAGVTASFNPPSLTSTGGDPTSTLTINTTASTPTGTTSFTVLAGNGTGCQTGTASGSGSLLVTSASNPVPTTTSISPTSKTVGDAEFFMTVNGTNFIAGSKVKFNGSDRATAFVSSTQLTATIPASDLTTTGTFPITVFNPTPGGGTSNAQTFTVNKKNLTISGAVADNKTYDGTTAATINFAGATLSGVVGTDVVTINSSGYSASFADKNVGNAKSITVSGVTLSGANASNYTVSQPSGLTADITKASLTVTAQDASREYGDANPIFTVLFGNFVNSETLATSGVSGTPNCSSTATATSPAGLTTYPISCTAGSLASGNYTFNFVDGKLTITKANLSVSAANASREYGDANPSFAPQYGAFKNSETASALTTAPTCSSAATEASAAGDYSIVCSGGVSSNYNFSYTAGTLTITKATLTIKANDKSREYGDANPAFDGTIAGIKNSDNISATYASSATAASAAGTFSIIPTLVDADNKAGNYNITLTNGTLTVNTRAVTVTADAKSKIYGDSDPNLTYSLSSGTLIAGDSFSGALTRAAGEAVGAYPIAKGSLALSSNYDLTFVGADLTVNARTITVAADAKTKQYGDNDPPLTFQITNGSLAFSDAFNGSLLRASGEAVGPYAIEQGTLTLNSNYNLIFNGNTLTITARPLTITANAGQSKTYGNAEPAAFTYSVTNGNLVGTDTLSGALNRVAGENVGSYAITQGTLSAGSNYALTFVSADFTITARAVTVTADAKSKTYGDSDPNLTYQITGGTLASGDEFTGALTRDPGEAVGQYAIKQGDLALNNNYDLTFVGANLSINKRAISVKVNVGQGKTYGENDPTLNVTVTGTLVNGDAFTGNIQRTSGENVGAYAITQGTLALSSNYELSFVEADFTIFARAVSIAADAKSKVYGDNDPSLTYQITDGTLVGTDDFAGNLVRDAGESVGSYAIKQGSVALSSNYALTYTGANLTINARSIEVTADAQTKVYGDADPAFTYEITNGTLVTGDSFNGSLTRDTGSSVGDYAIKQGTLALSGNYTLSFVGANLTITKKELTGSITASSKTYDGTNSAVILTRTLVSVINGDNVSYDGGTATFDDKNVGTGKIVNATGLSLSGTDAGNYTVNSTAATTANITSRTLSISAAADDKVYDGNANATVTLSDNRVTGDVFNVSFTSALFDNPNIGTGKTVTVSGIAVNGTDAGNYTLSSTTATTTANITAAGTTTSVSVSPTSVQYSDTVTFTANIAATNTSLNSSLAGSVQFKVNGTAFGSPVAATVNSSGGTASLTFNNQFAPSATAYNVSAVFTSTNQNLSDSTSGNAALTIKQENATATYSGAEYFATASSTSNTAQITLSATVVDNADGARGDIRNAVVEFRRDTPTGTLLGSASPVGLVNPTDPTVGTATTSFNYTLTGSEVNSAGATLTVYVIVKGYYTDGSEIANISIVIPGTESVNGGGYLVMQSSNGQFAGLTGSKMNFGYTMKFNKSGKNLQGQANIIVRGSDGKIYQIKSNAIDSLAVVGTNYPRTGTFTTKANMTDITNPLAPIALGGNLSLQVDMTDTTLGGQTDRVGITLWNSNGGLYFTSNWNGTKTIQQLLGGGNISVK